MVCRFLHLMRCLCRRATACLLSLAIIPAFLLPFEQTVWATEGMRITNATKASVVSTGASKSSKSTSGVSSSFATQAKTWQAYKLPHPSILPISPLTQLPVMADGASAMPSNANNFHGTMASVDPRTGSTSFSMPVASVLYDQGQGRRDLTLSYAGGPSALGPDPLGLGSHWSFNVGTEVPSTSEVAGHETTDITTGDGHRFTMVNAYKNGRTIWHPLRHKLGDVHITGQPGDWTIATSNGVREHLLNGYEDWEGSRDGQRVWFYYNQNGPHDLTRHLLYICAHPLTPLEIQGAVNACPYNGVHLTYHGGEITVQGQQTLVLHTFNVSGAPMVQSITMPSLSSQGVSNHDQPASVQFSYDVQGSRPWLLHAVTEPSGQKETFLYNHESDHTTLHPHGLPTGLNRAKLPVVTEQITTPPQPDQDIIPTQFMWYQYSGGTGDLHNYTGYQAGVSADPGKDNLMDKADSYTYTVTKDNSFTTTRTVYNKYHLPLTITQQDDIHHATIAKNNAIYSPWENTTFAALPPTFSMPKQTIKTLYSLTGKGNDYAVTPTKVVQQKQYNNDGQVIWKQDAYGRQIFTQYCPVQGDQHCPAMDPNWPQVTLPEKVLELPATHTPAGNTLQQNFTANKTPLPAVEVVYNYSLLPVSITYKNKVKYYKRLLQQGVKIHPVLEGMMNAQKMQNTVGADNSSLAGNWEVSAKTVGTLPEASVAHLKPGDALPSITSQRLITQTNYQYNLKQRSPTYGQMTQLTVTHGHHNNGPNVWVRGRQLQLLSLPESIKKETVNVTRSIDPRTHTRTVTMAVVHKGSLKDIKDTLPQLKGSVGGQGGGSLFLGTKVYSLVSGKKLSSEDSLKTFKARWTYDGWQRPIKEVLTPASGGKPHTVTWTYINTPQEQAVVKTTPDGNQGKVVYFGQGKHPKILSTWHRFKSQANASMEGVSNWIPDSKTTYTEAGKPASKTVYHAADPDGNTPGKTIALTATYGYDTLNRKVWEKGPDGIINVTVRNDPSLWLMNYSVATGASAKADTETLGPVLSVVRSNILGKAVAQYTFALNPTLKLHGKAIYTKSLQDQLQALEGQLRPANKLKTTASYGLLPLDGSGGLIAFVHAAINAHTWLALTKTTYDGNGRRISQTQPNGATTHWNWQQGNLTATIAPNGSMIHDTYNVIGKKTSRCVQPAGSSTCHILGEKGYDNGGNLAWQTDEHGNKITYTYDTDGRRLSMRTPGTKADPKGHLFTYTYNSVASTGEAIDGVLYVKYTYDPATWRLTDKEDRISHLHYTYDKNTRQLISITRSAPTTFKSPSGIHYPTGKQTITYDRYNQPVRITDLAGDTFRVTHDVLGRPVKRTVILPGQTTPDLLMTIKYDPYFNRPIQVRNSLGMSHTITYDSLGKVAQTTDRKQDAVLQTLGYTYDVKTHNMTSLTRTEGKTSATQHYTYDKKSNDLIGMTCSATGKPGTSSPLCPRETDLTGSGEVNPPIILSQHYTFDGWDNISSVTEQLITAKGKHTTKVTRYSYASTAGSSQDHYDPHQMLGFSRQWQNNSAGVNDAPQKITYDILGRVVTDADGNTLHYNSLGQMDRFTNHHTQEHTTYTYDSDGHQIAEQPFSANDQPLQAPLYMMYQGNTVSAQMQDDSHHHRHTSVELGGVAHSEDGVITRWYLHDYKGDVLSTYNANGQQTSDHIYSPYGMDYDRLAKTPQAFPVKLKLAGQTPWWKSHSPGFDNQMNDPATGYQFLGGGYRAYNPIYRHFMSHDSFSPFKTIDGYGFASNNPIMNIDPTGHLPQWASYAMGGIGIAMAIVAAVLLPVAVVAALPAAGAAAAAGATGVAVTTAVSSAGMGAIGVASGSLQIASAAHPQNKKLMIASLAFGIAGGLAAVGLGAMNAGGGVANMVAGAGLLTSIFIITSGTTGALAGVSGVGASSIGIALTADPGLTTQAGWKDAQSVLGYVSMVFMAVSIASGIGAFVVKGGNAAYDFYKARNQEQSTLANDDAAQNNRGVSRYRGRNGGRRTFRQALARAKNLLRAMIRRRLRNRREGLLNRAIDSVARFMQERLRPAIRNGTVNSGRGAASGASAASGTGAAPEAAAGGGGSRTTGSLTSRLLRRATPLLRHVLQNISSSRGRGTYFDN